MTSPDDVSERNQRTGTWVPRIAVVVLSAMWIVLAATLPVGAYRDLTVDVSCASGNPVVAIWIESRSGGSGFAQRGLRGSAAAHRYTFRQTFAGEYQVRVGCGGRPEHWGITVVSSYLDRPYRLVSCDDLTLASANSNGCADQSGI